MSVVVASVRQFTASWGKARNVIPVYVGRPSPLGNPFSEKTEGSREAAISAFRPWLREVMQDSAHPATEQLELLRRLHSEGYVVVLLCWCEPLPCHARVVRDAILDPARFVVEAN